MHFYSNKYSDEHEKNLNSLQNDKVKSSLSFLDRKANLDISNNFRSCKNHFFNYYYCMITIK